MTTEKKITGKRELAIRLSNGSVNINEVSKGLSRIVELWLSRKEIILINNELILA